MDKSKFDHVVGGGNGTWTNKRVAVIGPSVTSNEFVIVQDGHANVTSLLRSEVKPAPPEPLVVYANKHELDALRQGLATELMVSRIGSTRFTHPITIPAESIAAAEKEAK